MKKLFTLLTVVLLTLFSAQAWGADTYTLSYDKKTLTITTNGAMSNYTSSSKAAWNTTTNTGTVTKIVINNTVTSIGNYAFDGFNKVTTITFNATSKITTIGDYAFRNCTALTTVSIPNTVTGIGVSAFEGCTGITTVSLVSTTAVASIGKNAFKGCTNLTKWNASTDRSLQIPASVTSLGDYAFSGCTALPGTIFFGSGLTSTGNYTFQNCKKIETILFASGFQITTIGNYSFDGCTSLTTFGGTANKIAPYAGITTIGNYAFRGCTAITAVTIPNTVTSLGTYVFNGCSALATISFTSTSKVPSIGNYAFQNCAALTSITIPTSVTSIGTYAFSGCVALKSITIPTSITSLGTYAFSGCTALATLTFSSTSKVPSISNYAFQNCSALTSVTIPKSVTTIGTSAFSGCTALTTVKFGSSTTNSCALTTINGSAFAGCTKVANVYCYGSSTTNNNADALKRWMRITFNAASANPFYDSEVLAENQKFYLNSTSTTTIDIDTTAVKSNTFCGNKAIATVNVPATTTSFGSGAFDRCGEFNLNYAGALEQWCNITFSNATSNPISASHKINIGGNAITDLYLPDDLATVKNYAFYGCSSLQSISIKVGTTYGADSFTDCCDLTFRGDIAGNCGLEGDNLTYSLVDGVLTISGTGAMANYSSTSNIPWYMYRNSIKSIILPEGMTTIGTRAFYGLANITQATIPSSVESIGDFAFNLCSGITKTTFKGTLAQWLAITFGNSTSNPTYYSKSLYIGSTKLTTLTVPDGTTSINAYAFYNNTALTRVTLPASVTSLGTSAFYNCTGINSITINNTDAAVTLGTSALYNVPKTATINIAGALYTDYKATWKDFAYVATGSCGTSLNYTFTSSTGELKFTGSGAMSNYTTTSSPWNAFKTEIKSITWASGQTTIGNYAFYGCTGLTGEITIPKQFTTIGTYAFKDCAGIETFRIDGLSSIATLPTGILQGCTAMTILYIPSSVANINGAALSGCTALNRIYAARATAPTALSTTFTSVPKTCKIQVVSEEAKTSYSTANYWKEFTYEVYSLVGSHWTYGPDDAKWLKMTFHSLDTETMTIYTTASAGSGINNLTGNDRNVEFKTNLVVTGGIMQGYNIRILEIEDNGFENCTNLTGITIPDGTITKIGANAFKGCTGITSCTIGASVTTILGNAFYGCNNLEIVKFGTSTSNPCGITSIGSNAFYNCTKVAKVYCYGNAYTSAAALGRWLDITFANEYSNPFAASTVANKEFYAYTKTTALSIPEGTTTIKNYAFYNFTSLTSITLPESLTSIKNLAFSKCTNVATLKYNPTSIASFIYDKVHPFKELGSNVSELSIVLGANVTKIPSYFLYAISSSSGAPTYHYFSNVKAITIPASVQSIGSSAFSGCKNLTSVTTLAVTPPAATSAFPNAANATLTVPCESKAQYASATYWKSFKTILPYAITYDMNGMGTQVASDCSDGDPITQPDDPEAANYTFGGWYTDQACTAEYNFSAAVTGDLTLFAKWTKQAAAITLVDYDSNEAVLTENNNETVNATVARTFYSDGGYNTICVPFAVDADQVEDVFGEGTKLYTLTSSTYENEQYEFVFGETTAIAAGTPYLLAPADEVENPVFNNVTINKDANTKTTTQYVDFIGSFNPVVNFPTDENFLFLGPDGTTLYYNNEPNATLKGLRCYWQLKAGAALVPARIVIGNRAPTANPLVSDTPRATKQLRDGKLIINREGRTYNAQGALIR